MKNKFTQKAAALLCSKKALNRARTAHRLLSMTAIIACLAVVPAFADNEALNAVNKLSDTIFALIKAVGLICAGWGVLQLGMSVQSHDAAHAGRSLYSRWSADLLCKGNPDQHWCSLIHEGVDFLCG